MISVLFFALLILAVVHFIYEGIIAPSLRLDLRFQLFCLRDRSRFMKAELEDGFPSDAFCLQQNSINNAISLLPFLNIVLIRQALAAFKKDDALVKQVQERLAIIESCRVPEVQKIEEETNHLLIRALVINNAGLLLYLVPVIVPVALTTQALEKLTLWLKKTVAVPEQDIEKVIPPENRFLRAAS